MLQEELRQLRGAIAAERRKNEGGAAKTEMRAVVALYNTHADAEEAVGARQRSRFDWQKLSQLLTPKTKSPLTRQKPRNRRKAS